jgi:DNA-binding transcriptional LysR family regulator
MSPIQNIHTKSNDWIGLTKDWDALPEVAVAKEYFGREPIMHAPTYRALFELVKSTGFSGVGPSFMCKDYPDIEPRLDADDMQTCDVWIVYHETRKKDPAIRAVASWLEEIFPSTGLQ